MRTVGNFARHFGPFADTVKFVSPHIPKAVTDDAKVRFEAFKRLVIDLSGVPAGKTATRRTRHRPRGRGSAGTCRSSSTS